jgi:hypothetical protein
VDLRLATAHNRCLSDTNTSPQRQQGVIPHNTSPQRQQGVIPHNTSPQRQQGVIPHNWENLVVVGPWRCAWGDLSFEICHVSFVIFLRNFGGTLQRTVAASWERVVDCASAVPRRAKASHPNDKRQTPNDK